MNDKKAWFSGLSLIIAAVLFGELTVVFWESFYDRLGLNRNLILTLPWLLPAIAAFLVAYFCKKRRMLKVSSLVFALVILGPLCHFLLGEFVAKIDFSGLASLRVTFHIYLFLGLLTVGAGAVTGFILRKSES